MRAQQGFDRWAGGWDPARWEVLADSPEFMHMDEDIESLTCHC